MDFSWFTETDTELPSYPWEMNMKRWDEVSRFRFTYQVKRLSMIADGWRFFKNMSLDWDSDELLSVTGPEHTPSAWATYWDPGTWTLPLTASGWDVLLDTCWLALESGGALSRDEDGWKLGLSDPLIGIRYDVIFYVGLLSRHIWVMHQLKVAMCIEMVFCMDNRGRPITP